MIKSTRGVAIIASVVVLALCLGVPSAGKVAPVRKRIVQAVPPVKAVEVRHEDAVILLEAFMVEVRLSALYSLGVPAVSEGSKSVSAEQILKLLKDTDSAAVTAGAKLTVGQGNKGKTQSTIEQPIYTGSREKKSVEYVSVATSLVAMAAVRREGKISAEFEFEHTGVQQADPKTDMPHRLVRKDWSSSLSLEPGKPTLIGATQDENTAVFLIVTASVKE